MIWIWLLLTVVALASVASGLVLCLPYWRSPEKRWRDRVLRAVRAAQRQVQAEQAQLQRLSRKYRDETQALARNALERFLTGISVNELEDYPGIGPATIGRLKQAGFHNLAGLQNVRIRVYGLGQKRLATVYAAVGQLTRQAKSRFEAGACPEAQELAAPLQALQARSRELESRANARAKAAADVVRQLEPCVAIARQLTFRKYLWKEPHDMVPPEWLHRPLPDLHAAVMSAEQQASKAISNQDGAPRSERAPRTGVPAGGESAAASAKAVTRPAAISAFEKQGAGSTCPPERRLSSMQSAPAPTAGRAAQAQRMSDPAQELLEATVEFAFAVARTDGSISRKETEFIEEQMQQRYSHDAALFNRAKAWCAHYATGAIDVESCLQRVKETLTPGQRGQLFQLGCQIAQASGPINAREARLLERASREWGVPWKPTAVAPVDTPQTTEPAPAQAAVVPQEPPASEARALLEIDSSARLTANLIRRQYNLLSSRLAPEKLESLGPEFVAMAEGKRQAIRAAAETLIQPLGEPLDLPAQPGTPAELRHNPDLDAMFGA